MRLYTPKSPSLWFSFLVTTTAMLSIAFVCLFQFISSTPAFSASVAVGELFSVSSDSDVKLKYIGDYRKDVKAFVKRSKVKDDPYARVGAIVDLCLLHDEVVNDPRFENNYQLRGVRGVASGRLKKCRREIESEIKKFERKHPRRSKSDRRASQELQDCREADERRESPGSDEDYSIRKSVDEQQLNHWAIADMQLIAQITGGPVSLWNHVGGQHGPGICDYGPDLVRLIETTINSEFWRRNGGTGIIEYYQPLRILVVGASAQVHNQMNDLLETLRANGR